eukprot:1191092-Prorocentrum_minimum.AAC.2
MASSMRGGRSALAAALCCGSRNRRGTPPGDGVSVCGGVAGAGAAGANSVRSNTREGAAASCCRVHSRE